MDDNYESYTTATTAWPRGEILQITSAVDTVIASFPIQFVRQGGSDTWEYIAFVLSLLVVEEPDNPRAIVDADFNPVPLDAQPVAGVFRYVNIAASMYSSTNPTDS